MTTIAYADGVLASDSQVTAGGLADQAPFKKIYEPDEGKSWSIYGKRILAIAVCGEAAGIYELIAALEKGIHFESKGKQDAWTSCIAVADDKSVFVVDGYGDRKNSLFVHLPVGAKVGKGSGGEVATAYMAINKKAPEAVKLAIKLDVYSGGDVQVWTFPEVVPPVVAAPVTSKSQQDLIDKVAKDLESIRASALEKATADILEKTKEPETAKA